MSADTSIKVKKEELGFDAAPQADSDNPNLGYTSVVDEFLSGFYIVGSMKYVYKGGSIRQHLTLLRREWPSRLNNMT